MAQDGEDKAAEEAQKAYAAATEAKPEPVQPAPVAEPVAPAAVIVAEEPPVAEKAQAQAKAANPAKKSPAKKAPVKKAEAPAPKQAKPVFKRKPAVRKPITPTKIAKPAAKSRPATPDQSVDALKEKIMATAKKSTPEIGKLLQTAQTKAKEAYAKGAAAAGEVGAFSKGNVEAVVASGKILGAGVKSLGKDAVAESKGAIDTFTADLKAFAAVKSPTELFQLQGKLARRNFDNAVSYGSKTSESLVKLANEVFAPISNRVSLAVDKISKAA